MRLHFHPGKSAALLAALMLLLSAPAISNSSPQASYTLVAIKIIGLNRFTEAQIGRATGLHVGDTVNQPRLAAAADRLSKSGAFEHVSFRFFTEKNQLTVEFQVTETQRFLPCKFENFVWFSDKQLEETLRSRVTFYAGGVPEGGTTVDDVRAALRDLIRANGIPGDVDSIPFAQGIGQPISGFSFTVRGISMPIQSVDFPNASAVPPRDLVAASSQMLRRNFSTTDVATFASNGLLPLYYQRGYLRARFDRPAARVLSKSADGAVQEIAVTLPVEEGREYYWEKAEWSGNQKFTSEELDRLLGMKPKEIANQQKIDNGLVAVKHAYEQQGFIDALVQPKVILDDGTQLTTYDVAVVEGAQYRVSQVHFEGLADLAVKELIKEWRLKPGDVFDLAYATEFVNTTAPQTLHELGITRTHVEVKPERDIKKAIVDLHIIYH